MMDGPFRKLSDKSALSKPNKIRTYSLNAFISLITLILCLLAGEGIIRLLRNPDEYLALNLVDDAVLKWRLPPYASGHDAWGYRNSSVPDQADIVSIGDSQTYGIGTSAEYSWPEILQRLIQKDVYNMSLGGYGPIQYYYLLKNQAVKLKPSLVIIGFYLGNDLRDAYCMVHEHAYWRHLKKPEFYQGEVGSLYSDYPPERSALRGTIMSWLEHHSVLYSLAAYNFTEGVNRLLQGDNADVTVLRGSTHGISTWFKPAVRLSITDLDDSRLREGLMISLDLFTEMNTFCEERDTRFVILMIPTKESVYAQFIKQNQALHNYELLNRAISSEHRANTLAKEYFKEHHIEYVDPLPALQEAAAGIQLYAGNLDGHPTRHGYEIIAKSLYQYLQLPK